MKWILLLNIFSAHSHDAHVHGVAELKMAIEGKTAEIEFECPSESLWGFEHQAKTAEDKKKMSDALSIFQNKGRELFSLDSKLGCTFENKKAKVNHHGGHADVDAAWSVTCEKPLTGNSMSFPLLKVFSHIHELHVEVLSGPASKATSKVIEDAKTSVKIP